MSYSHPDYVEHRGNDLPVPGDEPPTVALANPSDSGPPSGQQAGNTISETSPTEIVEAEYARLHESVKRFLALEVYSIRRREALGDTHDLVDDKRAVLIRYQQLKNDEAAVPVSSAKMPLFYTFGVNIGVGILLNIPVTPVLLSASILFFGTVLPGPLISIFIRLRTFVYSATAHVRHTFRGGNGNAGIGTELTNTNTRRTAPGLHGVEEGTARRGAENDTS